MHKHWSQWALCLALLSVAYPAHAQDGADPGVATTPLALLAGSPATADGRNLRESWIRELPAVQTVRDQIRGTDASDTTLLEPIDLPACRRNAPVPPDLMGIGRGAAETCKCDVPSCLPPPLKQAILPTLSSARARLTWQPVLLANPACPAWMKSGGSCIVMIAVANGVAPGALVPTGLDANTIEAHLAVKYQQPAMDGDEVQRKNRITLDVSSHTTERTWTPGGLSVSFEPVSRDCTHGRILIQTSLMRELP
jgi:hypothetical protein